MHYYQDLQNQWQMLDNISSYCSQQCSAVDTSTQRVNALVPPCTEEMSESKLLPAGLSVWYRKIRLGVFLLLGAEGKACIMQICKVCSNSTCVHGR